MYILPARTSEFLYRVCSLSKIIEKIGIISQIINNELLEIKFFIFSPYRQNLYVILYYILFN